MTRMTAAAATQHWSGFNLRCLSCQHITQNRYPGQKTQRALRRLTAAAQRAPCPNCHAKNWKPA